MSINNYYYEDFANFIIKIFKENNKEKYLSELNLQKDNDLLLDIFLEPKNYIKQNYLDWNDEIWIESMQYIKMGLLSFLYKNKASLKKIYDYLEENHIKQHILLEKYKILFKNIIELNELTKMSQYIIKENIELDEIERKKFYLMFNLKNFKNPKFIAYLFDIMTYKIFRTNIVKYLLDNAKKINIENIIETESIFKENFIEETLEYFIKNDYFNLFINYLMLIDIEGDIVVNKNIQIKINTYIQDILHNSSKLDYYLTKIIEKNILAKDKFISKINLIIIDDNVSSKDELNFYLNTKSNKFIKTYENANNIKLESINLDIPYQKVFIEKNTIKFTKKDVIDRILNFIYLIVEFITVNISKDNKTKIDNINNIITNNLNFFSNFSDDKEEFNSFANIIKTNGFITNNNINQNNYTNIKDFLTKYSQNIINNFLNNFVYEKEDLEELISIFKKYKLKFNLYKTINFSDIDRSSYTFFTDLFNELIKNKKMIQIIILEILKINHLIEFLNYLESKTIFQLNEICKKKIIECLMQIIEKFTELIKNNEINIDNQYINIDKFLVFLGNILDVIYFYFKKYNSTKNEPKVKQMVKYTSIRKYK